MTSIARLSMRRLRRSYAAIVLVLVLGCAMGLTACGRHRPSELSFSVSSPTRPFLRAYLVYVPRTLPANPQVVLFLHGSASAGIEIAHSGANFEGLADRYQFLAVFPSAVQGTDANGRTGGFWSAGQCIAPQPEPCRPLPETPLRTEIGAVDDVAYLRNVIDDVARRYQVDRSRVYAWGDSLGAFMVQRVACELADRVASVVSVEGALTQNPCTPTRPVSIQLYQTRDDLSVPLGGNELFAPITDTLAAWRTINGCQASTTAESTPLYSVEASACARGTSVEFVLLDHGGHDWIYEPRPVIDWFPRTWRFLQEHPLA